jgi:hypothetical protein
MRAGTLDGSVWSQAGREWIVHEEQTEDGWHSWSECGECGETVTGGDDARAAHECRPCPECGEPGAEDTVRRYGGVISRTWNCCGSEVRCPGCGAEAATVLRYDDRVGAHCTRCSWSAS